MYLSHYAIKRAKDSNFFICVIVKLGKFCATRQFFPRVRVRLGVPVWFHSQDNILYKCIHLRYIPTGKLLILLLLFATEGCMNCSVLPGPYAVDRAPRAERTTCNTPADTAALTSGPAQAHRMVCAMLKKMCTLDMQFFRFSLRI